MIFGHIEGKEEHLTVSTEEGNEMSSSNMTEVEKVVRVYVLNSSFKFILSGSHNLVLPLWTLTLNNLLIICRLRLQKLDYRSVCIHVPALYFQYLL